MPIQSAPSARQIFYLIAITLLLSACGFKLRSQPLSADFPFKSIYIAAPDSSPVGADLKRYLRNAGEVAMATDPKSAQAIFDLMSEARSKEIRSLNTQGRVREYALYYRVTFRLRDQQEKELLAPTEIVLKRDISFNEAQIIAKEREEELLYRDMQTDAAQQILRRLAALK